MKSLEKKFEEVITNVKHNENLAEKLVEVAEDHFKGKKEENGKKDGDEGKKLTPSQQAAKDLADSAEQKK